MSRAFSKISISVIFIIFAAGGFFAWQYFSGQKEEAEVSKQEQKSEGETAGWKAHRNEEDRFDFKYPEKLNTKYIQLTHPLPEISVEPTDPIFSCDQGLISKKGLYFGNVSENTINGNNYCVAEGSEGAMGHIYKTYYYITEIQSKQITLKFVLSYSGCGALYGIDNKMQECEKEQDEFDVNLLVGQIFSTFRFLDQ